MKRVLILGSTGSIGLQALEVIAGSDSLKVAGLAGGSNYRALAAQADAFDVSHLAIVEESAGTRLAQELPEAVVLSGPGCIRGLIEQVDCDLVLNAVVGAVGLEATVATLEKGVDLALANKESLVVGGEYVTNLAQEKGSLILPVDSEHSAVFQCLRGERRQELDKIWLTASGGPFMGRPRAELANVTVEDALNHPRWEMGSKITIDSATLMNKGLEIIEAHYLFDVPYSRIEVIVHPQSIVHSLVRFNDGSVISQMGLPSMKLPIAFALNYPDRTSVEAPQLHLPAERELTFFEPDEAAFPSLRIAREAGERGGGAPIVLNAANEMAVAAFLAGRIGFLEIADMVERTMDAIAGSLPVRLSGLEEIDAIDSEARRAAESLIIQ
ncbi:MAG: 1-deoxy-D-xylulose-5-phosphate reductoisomerase [Thermoleophilia bacterium]|nr:1-deoxy-D-xylulose-5-phosphate reductoisomerase [Thermoleophilia bacterium]